MLVQVPFYRAKYADDATILVVLYSPGMYFQIFKMNFPLNYKIYSLRFRQRSKIAIEKFGQTFKKD